MTKTITKKQTFTTAKWLPEEALQIAVKRREAGGKGERGRYPQLNAEFQRIARGEKKAFLDEQCKEIEENNRMEKTRDLLRKLEIPREHFGEGHGNPLQYSFLENPVDGGAWWAAVHGVAQNWTQLKRLSTARENFMQRWAQ